MIKNIFKVVVFLVIGYVVNFVASIIISLKDHTLLAGQAGFPFKSSSGSLAGTGGVDVFLESVNILFWSLTVFIIWFLIKKALKK